MKLEAVAINAKSIQKTRNTFSRQTAQQVKRNTFSLMVNCPFEKKISSVHVNVFKGPTSCKNLDYEGFLIVIYVSSLSVSKEWTERQT